MRPPHCPRCGASIDPAQAEGWIRCGHCGSVLYEVSGRELPVRRVSARSSDQEIRRVVHSAAGAASRRGERDSGAALRISHYLVPYYVETASAAGGCAGWAACSLPVPTLRRIEIFGSDTRWFLPEEVPQGTRLVSPTLDVEAAAEEARIGELRYVPLAHVTPAPDTDGGPAFSVWVDASRGRILCGLPPLPVPAARTAASALPCFLTMGGAAMLGLLLPMPWSVLACGALPFLMASVRRFPDFGRARVGP